MANKNTSKQSKSKDIAAQSQTDNASQEVNDAHSIVPIGYFGNQASRRPAKRPTTGNEMLLQWFNGLSAGRQLAVGWHIQASRCSEELTEALKTLGVPRMTVLHKMSGELVEYWSLGTCSLIVLCDGFGDMWELRNSQERTGIAYGWVPGKNRSKMKCKAFVAELASLEQPYLEPFTITMEGYIIESFLQALEMQFQVLDAYEQLTGNTAPFCGFSLTIGAAEHPRQVGKGIKKNTIIPTVAILPEEVDAAYLSNHLCTPELMKKIIEQDLVSKAIQWSMDVSQRINEGMDREHYEEQAPVASASNDEAMQQTEPSQPAQRIKKLGNIKSQLRDLGLVTNKQEWAALKNRLDIEHDDQTISEQDIDALLIYMNANSKRPRQRKN